MNEFDLAAYLDRRLDSLERDRIDRHLASCAECREEVLAVKGLMHRTAKARRWLVAGGMLATAAALLLFLRPEPPSPVRAPADAAPLRTHGPTGEVAPSAIRFLWGSAPGAVSYRLTLSGADGTPLWSASTADTSVALPDSVRLEPGHAYVWVVDALLDDGASRSTGLHDFRLGP